MLLCPVRACQQALSREDRRAVCPRGHSFDFARSGYLNLLQPQDRRSKEPGDSAAAVAARRRLHDSGATGPLLSEIGRALNPGAADTVLDAGCGDGFYLGSLARAAGFSAWGVDLAIPAIDAAARRFPECHWVVANADRQLPFENGSFSRLLSITARMNTAEFRRVLRPDGLLLVGVPAADDLIELRGTGRSRVDRTVETFAPSFRLIRRSSARTAAYLDADAVADLLLSIYRPLRNEPAGAMRVTFSLDLLLFAPV